ncbi:MAG: hypothetical protein A3E84_00955 [Gammaproteobacteria bacterium RIFCSPHIGHO2_12_FULL_42_13]|nr:MAG: hypothetical protein A3E84_00955 [Gammaproteobacteria bacterium RIFCSPHIGHO2_12_FULL_42_13]
METSNLVLLPGLLSNHIIWDHQCRHLSDIVNIKVIELFSENTTEAMVDKILQLAPEKFALAGHSMGGWLALEIVKASPERVTKLCLLNTTAHQDTPEKAQNRINMINMAKNGEFHQIVTQIIERLVFNEPIKERVLTMFLQVGAQAFINQQQAMLARKYSLAYLQLIKQMTFVIHANQDKNFSLSDHQHIVNNIDKAKLASVDDSGHMMPMEMPQAVTSLMRYWLEYL